jgi:thiol-disulfide isomerase/thioredoxin
VNQAGAVILVAVLLAATAFALWRRRTDGRLTDVPDTAATASGASGDTSDGSFPVAELGLQLGRRATLVQFSTAFCQPCRATRTVLTEVADMVDGVVAVDVDAESHLDVVRRLGILRTPTVFVLDGGGVVRQRASGAPRKADVIAAIGALDEVSG